jgi:hypothetical protein
MASLIDRVVVLLKLGESVVMIVEAGYLASWGLKMREYQIPVG